MNKYIHFIRVESAECRIAYALVADIYFLCNMCYFISDWFVRAWSVWMVSISLSLFYPAPPLASAASLAFCDCHASLSTCVYLSGISKQHDGFPFPFCSALAVSYFFFTRCAIVALCERCAEPNMFAVGLTCSTIPAVCLLFGHFCVCDADYPKIIVTSPSFILIPFFSADTIQWSRFILLYATNEFRLMEEFFFQCIQHLCGPTQLVSTDKWCFWYANFGPHPHFYLMQPSGEPPQPKQH